MKRSEFSEWCRAGVRLLDGATGTNLMRAGMPRGVCTEQWVLEHPQTILKLQRDYAAAGSEVLYAPTFCANRYALKDYGLEERLHTMNVSLVQLTRKAAGAGVLVAGDMTTLGRPVDENGAHSYQALLRVYREQAEALLDGGVDLFAVETMMGVTESMAAVEAIRSVCDLPILCTLSVQSDGKAYFDGNAAEAAASLEELGADAVGVNCASGPDQLESVVRMMKNACTLPIVAKPNAGLPVMTEHGEAVYPMDAQQFAEGVERLVQAGASLIGGCCGTTPEHIRLLAERLKNKPVKARHIEKKTVVSSYTHTVTFGARPILIGERINPTGKPRLKQALREGDLEYLCREGIAQTEHGADILDVNVGLPELDEPAVMERAIINLQSVTNTPLQIDTSNVEAMERALRIYNGKPLVNSVNGKEESLHTVLPLVKKYGAAVVALTLDEKGIPASAAERVAIAEKILKTAESYGIDRSDVIIDTLAMTVSTGADNAIITLDALDTIRHKLGVHTVLGVSNISFGLPRRELVTSTFFAMAMQRGLSSGIINPLSDELMKAYRSFCALIGIDVGCKAYIEAYANTTAAPDVRTGAAQQSAGGSAESVSLHRAIVKGLREQAGQLTDEMLKTTPPLEIINGELIPALDEVGQGFEKNTVFLPQLLMSADAAKEAFERIKQNLAKKGIQEEKKGTIILATVKGDIHDIGKNIVKVLLENYGFDVLDLGKDVPPEIIVQTAIEKNVRLVGLSALMTTTVESMAETIRQLRKAHDCKVMVGGAVLNPEYAKEIGADFYSKDAMGSVRYAEKLFNGEV